MVGTKHIVVLPGGLPLATVWPMVREELLFSSIRTIDARVSLLGQSETV